MYLNDAQLSLTGYVATQPMVRTVKSGATNLSMRVAWTPRRQDRVTGEWTDGNTSYVTVICWRRLATNGAVCLRKGDPVVVKGRLSIRNYEDKEGVRRIAVEVEASSVGHDLSRGVAQFQRVRPQTGLTAAEYSAANGEGAYPLGPGRPAGELGTGADRSEYPVPDDPGPEDPFFHDADLAGSMHADLAGPMEVTATDEPGGPASGGEAGREVGGEAGAESADGELSDGELVGAARAPVVTPF